ncbi:MAG: hypothetical protein ACE5KH_01470 [Candidatus Geothermarchaeales archaeon]
MSTQLLLETSFYSCQECGHSTNLWEVVRSMDIETAREAGYLVIGKEILFTNSFLGGVFECPECSTVAQHTPVEREL